MVTIVMKYSRYCQKHLTDKEDGEGAKQQEDVWNDT